MEKHGKILTFFTLLTSFSTLICCALPALLVMLGMSATFAGLVSTFPQLIWLGEHKVYLFVFSGIMLSLAGFLQYRSRFIPCPMDPALARSCTQTRNISRIIYFVSLTMYLIGFFFAFIAAKLIS